MTSSPATFQSLYASLLKHPSPLLPPPKPHDRQLSNTITSLQLHPSLEALLHILNADLPSAHFLVRHMQAAPAHEGMYIHGLLHRVEGDYDNARAWYADVCEQDVFSSFWGAIDVKEQQERDKDKVQKGDDGYYRAGAGHGKKLPAQTSARTFLDAIESLRGQKGGPRANETTTAALEQQSHDEIAALVSWCVDKFGTRAWTDATQVWVQNSSENREIAQKMVTGGEGYRKF